MEFIADLRWEGATMLRQRRVFRPVVGARLEDRTVPSPFGFGGFFGGFGGFFGRGIASVPAQDARQVAQEFGTFQQTYSQDVRSILLPAGTTNPASNRPAFDAAVATALGTLHQSIDTTIGNLPSSSSLAATIQGELLGSGPNTLQTLLAAIPTPTNIRFGSFRVFNREAALFINQVEGNVVSQVRTAQAPSGSISPTTIQQDLGQVQTAFQTFRQTYFNDVQTILLPSGTTDPSANRAAFDQAVGTALGTLNTAIDSALSNLPTALTATLNTTIQNDLLSSGSSTGSSLQARLAALQTPASTPSFSAFVFRLSSSQTIASAQGQVTRDIAIAVNQYNAGLSGSTPPG
jgi:hypothetical protein